MIQVTWSVAPVAVETRGLVVSDLPTNRLL